MNIHGACFTKLVSYLFVLNSDDEGLASFYDSGGILDIAGTCFHRLYIYYLTILCQFIRDIIII